MLNVACLFVHVFFSVMAYFWSGVTAPPTDLDDDPQWGYAYLSGDENNPDIPRRISGVLQWR